MFEKITSDNIIMFAMKHYDNPQCDGEHEFQDDLKRFKYIKRLLKKYIDTQILIERLLLNHFLVIKNVFGSTAAITLLLHKLERIHYPAMKSFLIYLNMLHDYELKFIDEDKYVLETLKEL